MVEKALADAKLHIQPILKAEELVIYHIEF